jgi:hypothetical protein
LLKEGGYYFYYFGSLDDSSESFWFYIKIIKIKNNKEAVVDYFSKSTAIKRRMIFLYDLYIPLLKEIDKTIFYDVMRKKYKDEHKEV